MENKEYYRKLFPLLTHYELEINSESILYNRVSHTLNIKNIPSWPTELDYYWPVKRELTQKAFDLFYEYHGFKKLSSLDFSYDVNYIKVALYTNGGIPKHVSLQVDKDWWESKIGSLGIIRHDLFELEDNTYGNVSVIYKKAKNTNEVLFFDNFIRTL